MARDKAKKEEAEKKRQDALAKVPVKPTPKVDKKRLENLSKPKDLQKVGK